MKLRLLTTAAIGLGMVLTLQSVSSGRAASGGQDRIGAPGSLGTDCTLCHSSPGAFTNPAIAIAVTDGNGNAVTSYMPGQTYNVSFTVTSDGSPAGYGMQAVALDASNANIGDFTGTTTNNTQLVTIGNGREIIEHQGRSSTGVFTGTWEAPAAGSGAVTIYGIGMAVNGGGTSGDNTSSTSQFTLSEDVASSLNKVADQAIDVAVFPMPNQGVFQVINQGKQAETTLQLVDLQGRILHSNQVILGQGETYNVNEPNLPAGIYLLHVQQGAEQRVEQIVVQ